MKTNSVGKTALLTGQSLLVNAAEAARLLAVSERTLWSLTSSGEIPAVRVRRCLRYAVRELEIYVEHLREVGRELTARKGGQTQ
jgi:excisionase family DNA binding protein